MPTKGRFRTNRRNEIIGFLLLSLAVIIFLSLASYEPLDTPAHSSAPNVPAHNKAGVVGAYVAESLLLAVGIGAYLLPLVLLIWAWNTFWGNIGKEIYLKLIGLLTMLVSVGALAQMIGLTLHGSQFRAGGIMGPFISDMLGGLFGMMGARVVAFTFFIISVLLTTEFLFFSFAMLVGAILVSMFMKAGRFVYEGVTGNGELPGGLSIAPKKKPSKIMSPAKGTAKRAEPAVRSEQREGHKDQRTETERPVGATGQEAREAKGCSSQESPQAAEAQFRCIRVAFDRPSRCSEGDKS